MSRWALPTATRTSFCRSKFSRGMVRDRVKFIWGYAGDTHFELLKFEPTCPGERGEIRTMRFVLRTTTRRSPTGSFSDPPPPGSHVRNASGAVQTSWRFRDRSGCPSTRCPLRHASSRPFQERIDLGNRAPAPLGLLGFGTNAKRSTATCSSRSRSAPCR